MSDLDEASFDNNSELSEVEHLSGGGDETQSGDYDEDLELSYDDIEETKEELKKQGQKQGATGIESKMAGIDIGNDEDEDDDDEDDDDDDDDDQDDESNESNTEQNYQNNLKATTGTGGVVLGDKEMAMTNNNVVVVVIATSLRVAKLCVFS